MDELYVKCPRCRGTRYISVCTAPGDGFSPSRWECINCPLCQATGEADIDLARKWQGELDASPSGP